MLSPDQRQVYEEYLATEPSYTSPALEVQSHKDESVYADAESTTIVPAE